MHKKDTISFTNTILKDIRLVEYSKVSWTSIINYFPIKMSEQNNIIFNRKDTMSFINTCSKDIRLVEYSNVSSTSIINYLLQKRHNTFY